MVTEKTKAKFQDDIVDDVLRRVLELAPGFTEALAKQVAKDVRHEWAGETSRICYIARREDELRSTRNDSIKRDYLAGEHFELLERRYRLTRRRLQQILKT